MAKFARHFATEKVEPQTFPRADVRSLADTGQGLEARALAQVGGALTDVSQILFKWNEREGNSEYDTLRGLYQSRIGEFGRTSYKDSAALKAGFDKLEGELAKIPSVEGLKNKKGLIKYKAFLELNKANRENMMGEKSIRMIALNNEIALFQNLSRLPQMTDRAAALKELDTLIEGGFDDGTIKTAQEALAMKKRFTDDIALARATEAIENIKPKLIVAIGVGDKEAGIEVLNASIKQLVEDDVLTEVQGAEANKKLGDWIDNFVAGRFKQAKESEKQTTHQIYKEMSGSIIGGNLSYDDIEQSKLLKADKEKWQEYVKGSYEDAPIENTPNGHDMSFNAVYDAATLQLSPADAYDVLLDIRFNDRSITNDQFNWGVDKIENPYPKHLIEDINATITSNNEDFNRLFSFDNERNKKVNESLLAWVDELIKQDKVPPFEFKKKMYAMSSQYRVGDDRWFDIGQVIERGGREWEVVGFDRNGEPLVEEVQ